MFVRREGRLSALRGMAVLIARSFPQDIFPLDAPDLVSARRHTTEAASTSHIVGWSKPGCLTILAMTIRSFG